MPQFKGEFNRLAKRRPIREALPVPAALKPAPALGGAEVEEVFGAYDRFIKEDPELREEISLLL